MFPDPITGRVRAIAYHSQDRRWDISVEVPGGRVERFTFHEPDLPAGLTNFATGDIISVRPVMLLSVTRTDGGAVIDYRRADPFAEGGAR